MTFIEDYRREYASVVDTEIKKYGISRNWDMSTVKCYVDGKEIKVDFGSKSYLKYVDQGTRPFLMHSLEGKIIPIGGSFRKVSGVGMPGMTSFERNGVVVKRFKDQKWKHPGIASQNFVEAAFKAADKELGYKSKTIKLMSAADIVLKKMKDTIDRLKWRHR